MALRVLLADDSSTIKKVMQLALQDFAVEVKAVPVGVDVLNVATTFKPDIVFMDVLLPKRNGYEVATELKAHPETKSVPVIMLWSPFMGLDEAAYKACGANAHLEKPFEVEALRAMVREWVPRTQENRLSQFLHYPDSVAQTDQVKEEEKQRAQKAPQAEVDIPPTPQPKAKAQPPPPPATPVVELPAPEEETAPSVIAMPGATARPEPAPAPEPVLTPASDSDEAASAWSMESFASIQDFSNPEPRGDEPKKLSAAEEDEDFKLFDLSTFQADPQLAEDLSVEQADAPPMEPELDLTQGSETLVAAEDEEPWSQKNLAKFKVDVPESALEGEVMSFDLDPQDEDTQGLILQPIPESVPPPANQRFALEQMPGSGKSAAASSPSPNIPPLPSLTAEQLEQIIRAQSKEIIEQVVQRVVPDIATDLIRRELDRLLKEQAEEAAR